ncbi:fatty acid desaturase [bacterium]|nr:fatty acid desaturase [bacterium]
MDKKTWHDKLKPFMAKSNTIALRQLFVTFGLYAAVWFLYVKALAVSAFFIIPFSVIMAFFVLRFFVLMHDCGHGALFSSPRANQIFGYLLGVLTGMPQFVWSKSHAYHHATNGDWEKFRGALNIKTIDEYQKLNSSQQRRYRLFRHPLSLIFLGGFFYVLFNPRFNWFVGLIKLSLDVLSAAIFDSVKKAKQILKEVPSKKWKSPREFRHMTYNNITLLAVWYLMSQAIGTYNFFIVYSIALSLAGGLGIVFFTAQHNFENSYAENTQNADYVRAALEGTSYLQLPNLINWFTADIGYHHIHHLSTSVPNYRLAACHKALEEEFLMVKRIRWNEIHHSITHLLWDTDKKIIVPFPR